MINRYGKMGLALLLSWMSAACVSPAGRIDGKAAQLGFERQTVWGTQFPHRVYFKGRVAGSHRLHVYIEGDGLPWSSPDRVSPDPTPRYALMLRLMAQDTRPAIYLGRPCYFGFAQTPPCSPLSWTQDRYARAMVESMAAALSRITAGRDDVELVLIGHSGGGALAVLLGQRLANAVAVVTVAGNLDTEAWTRLHGYSDLTGSLNPASLPALDRRIVQLHFQGGQDREIPPALAARFAARQPSAQFRLHPEFDHRCCWEEKWPELLGQVTHSLSASAFLPWRTSMESSDRSPND
jgi:pimeloyl-ACP methyl ester carboxylesterase